MAEGARTAATARKATEAELVADIDETVSLHGYKVIQHRVVVDHEKEETRLQVTMLKGNPEQQVLPLKKKAGGEDGDGSE